MTCLFARPTIPKVGCEKETTLSANAATGVAKPLLGRFKSGSDFGHVVVDVALDKREVAAIKDDAERLSTNA